MTAFSWTAALSGNWSTGIAWTPIGPPTADDSVAITATGLAYTVTVNAASAAGSLDVSSGNATLAVDDDLMLGAAASVLAAGAITVASGELDIASGGSLAVNGGTLTLGVKGVISGGELIAGGGAFAWQGGELDDEVISGTLDLSGSAASVTVGSGGLTVETPGGGSPGAVNLTGAGAVLTFAATESFDDATITFGNNTTASQFAIGAGATVTLGSGVTINQVGNAVLTGSNADDSIINDGVINANASGATLTIATITLTNSGTINVANGDTLAIGGALINDDVLNLNAASITGTTLTTQAGSTLAGNGVVAAIYSGAGTVTASGGTLAFTSDDDIFSGAINGSGTVAIEAAATINASETISVANIAITGGNGALTIADDDVFSSNVAIATDDSLVVGGSATLTGANAISGGIDGAGTLTISGGTTTLAVGAELSVDDIVQSGGTINVDATVAYSGALTQNAGAIVISADDDLTLSGASTLGATVSGTGPLTASGGTLTFVSGATLNVTTFNIGDDETVNINETLSYAGALQDTGGTIAIAGGNALNLSGVDDSLAGAASGALVISAGLTTLNGLAFNGGSLTISAGATVASTDDEILTIATKNAGMLEAGALATPGSLTIDDALTQTSAGVTEIESDSTLTLNAAVTGGAIGFGGGDDETLAINESAPGAKSFGAEIVGFGIGDKIAFTGGPVPTAVSSTVSGGNTILTVTAGGNAFAFTLEGDYTGAKFSISDDDVTVSGAIVQPVISGVASAVTYAIGSAGVLVAPDVTIGPANAEIDGATIKISKGAIADDMLTFTDENVISGSFDDDILTLTGTANVASYEAALQSVEFVTTNPNPTNGGTDTSRTLIITATSGADDNVLTSAPVTEVVDVSFPPQWKGPHSGAWDKAGNWTPAHTPTATGAPAILGSAGSPTPDPTYTATLTSGADGSASALDIMDANATLAVGDGHSLSLGDAAQSVNDGTILIEAPSHRKASSTDVGTLMLTAKTSLTNDGNIEAKSKGNFGGAANQIDGGAIANDDLIESLSGGLELLGVQVTNQTDGADVGAIEALTSGGSRGWVELDNATVNGGSLVQSAGGGHISGEGFYTASGSTKSVLDNVTLDGNLMVASKSDLTLEGTLTLGGDVVKLSRRGDAGLLIGGGVALDGAGEVILGGGGANPFGADRIGEAAHAASLDNKVDIIAEDKAKPSLIGGKRFVLDNAGIIEATAKAELTINTGKNRITNTGEFIADGTLNIDSAVTGTGAVDFGDSTGMLGLAHAESFSDLIKGLGRGNFVDLKDFRFPGARITDVTAGTFDKVAVVDVTVFDSSHNLTAMLVLDNSGGHYGTSASDYFLEADKTAKTPGTLFTVT